MECIKLNLVVYTCLRCVVVRWGHCRVKRWVSPLDVEKCGNLKAFVLFFWIIQIGKAEEDPWIGLLGGEP